MHQTKCPRHRHHGCTHHWRAERFQSECRQQYRQVIQHVTLDVQYLGQSSYLYVAY